MALTSSDNQFLAFLGMERAATIHVGRLVEIIKQKSGALAIPVHSLGDAPLGRPVMLAINGSPYTVMKLEQPLPADAYDAAARKALGWPQARAVVASCAAHLIAAPLKPAVSHAEALDQAAHLTLLCAALATVEGVKAVIWSSGDALSEASAFENAANEIALKRIPLFSWMTVAVTAGERTRQGKQTFGMTTCGLRPFIGREIEFEPAVMEPGDIAIRVVGLANDLVTRGLFLADGETVGLTEKELILVKDKPDGINVRGPVLSLSISGVVK